MQTEARGLDVQGRAVHPDRPAAAAALRRRQPAGPDRQLRREPIGFNTILDQLEDLDDVFEANNYEGTKIPDTLYPASKNPAPSTASSSRMNYVLTLYGLWYSDSLFKENGWTPPKT